MHAVKPAIADRGSPDRNADSLADSSGSMGRSTGSPSGP